MSDFAKPIFSNVKVKFMTNAAGDIASYSDMTYGTKYITIAGISATSNLSNSMKVFDTFIGDSLMGGDYDELSAVRTITQGVD